MSREDGDAVSQEGMDDDVLASDIAIVGMGLVCPMLSPWMSIGPT